VISSRNMSICFVTIVLVFFRTAVAYGFFQNFPMLRSFGIWLLWRTCSRCLLGRRTLLVQRLSAKKDGKSINCDLRDMWIFKF
jgi:hypothetical protein